MKVIYQVTVNPYRHNSTHAHTPRVWDEGYRQALLDVAQHMLTNGHAQVAKELLEVEDSLHATEKDL